MDWFLYDKGLHHERVKPEKHLLVTEIEKYLIEDDYDFSKSGQFKTALIIDFVSNLRKIDTTQCQIFKDILAKLWSISIIYNSCTFHFYCFERIMDTIWNRQNKRFIPVHKLLCKLDPHMCSNLFKAYILTSSDTASKIGTKAAAVIYGRIDYLINNFGLG